MGAIGKRRENEDEFDRLLRTYGMMPGHAISAEQMQQEKHETQDTLEIALKRLRRNPEPDEIPPLNQQYTVDGIVKFLVENTLGKLWLETKPCYVHLTCCWRCGRLSIQRFPHGRYRH